MKQFRFSSIAVLMVITMLITTACSSDDDQAEGANADYDTSEDEEIGFTEEREQEAQADSATEDRDDMNDSESTDANSAIDQSEDRMVIYTGTIAIEVEDYDHTYTTIVDELNDFNGYVVESNVHEHPEDDRKNGHIVVRIPEEHFNDFMNGVETNSEHVIEKTTEGNDVTEEYVDLESRLRSQEAVEERLLNFLDEADNTEDLLNISNDLARVQEEIEQIKGRMIYLEDHVAYSTVTINISEKRINIPEIESQDSLNTFEKAQQLFMGTVNWIISVFSNIIVFIVGLSPILIPILIIAVFYFIRYKRKNNPSD
ncbi:DUF4349 domain-containing protein [Alkalibacillus aidingensis]|uniref:DUF4349 domain-containing protein n=1 Tax=Alkalibacillus aidingensis TaxID=2747607 RepID=UPI001660293A|nr:DUF4349 domain-containing protein [Alkalibacillus aidingensis]